MDNNFRNVMFMSTSFWFVWLAFFSQSLIEEDVINKYSKNGQIDKHAGYISLAICFAVETVADPMSAMLVNWLEPKYTMFLGGLTSAIFTSCFLYLNEYALYFTSALFGVGSAALWIGQGNYLALNSNDKTAGKHSALFFAFFKSGLIMAGILLLIVVKIFNKSDDLSYTSIKILYGSFTAIALFGSGLFLMLPTPKKEISKIKPKLSPKEMLKSTLNLFMMKEMVLISLTSVYIGIQWSFWLSVYPTCVAFTKQLGEKGDPPVMLALCVIFTGIGQTGAAISCIYMSTKYPHIKPKMMTTFAIVVQISMFVLIFILFPKESSLDDTINTGVIKPIVPLTYIIPFFLGVGDVMLKSPMYTLIIRKLSGKSAEAFALFNFYQSLGCSTAFFYSTVLNLYWQLGILIIAAIIGGFSVIVVDKPTKKILLINSMEIYANEIQLDEKSYIDFDNQSVKSLSNNK